MAGVPPRRWAEQIVATGPCKPPYLCEFLNASVTLDINAADAGQLSRAFANFPEAAAIVADRTRNGPFTDLVDFARRICPQTGIDFQDASIRFGTDTLLVRRGSDPKNPGFKCARGTGEMELFGKKHNYVGHVTLLR